MKSLFRNLSTNKSTSIESSDKQSSNIFVKESDGLKMTFDVSEPNNPKPQKAEVTFNVFGEDITINYDFGEEAEEKRRIEREENRQKAWTEVSGNRITQAEKEILGDYYGYKKISQNGKYAVAYVRELVVGSSTGTGKVWLVDCVDKKVIYTKKTNIIGEVFVLNSGVIVFNDYKRDVKSDCLYACSFNGDIFFSKRKKCSIQLDDVIEPGKIIGHYLDSKYTSFKFHI